MFIDLVGQKFGRLLVIKFIGKNKNNRNFYWLCLCSCGEKTHVHTSDLMLRKTKSCGCYSDELSRIRMSVQGSKAPAYKHGLSNTRWKNRWQLYHLTESDYKKLVQKQLNCCAICKKSFQQCFEEKRLVQYVTWDVDHDHKTGRVRGLLCHKCNSILGLSNESIDTLLNAINYLKQNG